MKLKKYCRMLEKTRFVYVKTVNDENLKMMIDKLAIPDAFRNKKIVGIGAMSNMVTVEPMTDEELEEAFYLHDKSVITIMIEDTYNNERNDA